jgi:hypothetical protein
LKAFGNFGKDPTDRFIHFHAQTAFRGRNRLALFTSTKDKSEKQNKDSRLFTPTDAFHEETLRSDENT